MPLPVVGILGGSPPGGGLELAVGLVDRQDVGQLDDAALEALQLIAAARQQQQQEEVDQIRHCGLGLADADRLDDDHVEAGRLAQQHGLAAPRRPGCRRSATGG
jgi:hypothetical protein